MKKYIFIFLLIPVLSFAQTEKISFIKKLNYEMERDSYKSLLTAYYSPEALLVEIKEKNRVERKIINSNILANINFNIDKTITPLNRIAYLPQFTFIKTEDGDEVMGLKCRYYEVQEFSGLKLCIAENNVLNFLTYIKEKELKGLVLKMGYDDQMFTLKSIEEYSNYVNINTKEMISIADEVKRGEDRYSYEIYDPEASCIRNTLDITIDEYESKYKNNEEYEDNIDLAINELDKDSYYWKEIPSYCLHLEDNLPKFKDKEIKKHVHNYAGQLCDLYLSIENEDRVDRKATLDLIRYEEIYFRDNRDKFNKQDQKKLNEFLSNLD